MEKQRPFDGQVALVTGGSRGIGAGIVRRLASEGAAVAFTYAASEAKALQLVHEVETGHRAVCPMNQQPQCRNFMRHAGHMSRLKEVAALVEEAASHPRQKRFGNSMRSDASEKDRTVQRSRGLPASDGPQKEDLCQRCG